MGAEALALADRIVVMVRDLERLDGGGGGYGTVVWVHALEIVG